MDLSGSRLEQTRDYTLLILLSLVCGIQNGTVTTVSKAVIRTTHLTGITTDLGLGIVRFLNREKLRGEITNEGQANLMRVGIIVSFIAGSSVGGFLFNRFGFGGFSVPVCTSGILFTLMVYFQIKKRFKPIRDESSSPAPRQA